MIIVQKKIKCPKCKREIYPYIKIGIATSEGECYYCQTRIIRLDCDGEEEWCY